MQNATQEGRGEDMVEPTQPPVETPPEEQGKRDIIQSSFRLKAEEHAQLEALIQMAYKLKDIAKPSVQEFMMYAIDCARERLAMEYNADKKKG